MTAYEYRLDEIETADLSHTDLGREARETPGGTAHRVTVWVDGQQHAQTAEVLHYPELGRAGVAWGGDATWVYAGSALDAVTRMFDSDQ